MVIPARILLPSLGLWRSRRIRRILQLAGCDPAFRRTDAVAQWGAGRTARRSQRIATATGQPIVWIEDAFLRSLHPGRNGEPSIGLIIDPVGLYYDASRPSGLEELLAGHPLDGADLLQRAGDLIELQERLDVTKYAAHAEPLPPDLNDYVLVADQAFGDQAVVLGGGDKAAFERMLAAARAEHPDATILIKAHPEAATGHRGGYLEMADVDSDVRILRDRVSPWTLLRRARAVYTVTSQLGFEAILCGHRPVVFGQPFYAGWGLSDDRKPVARRQRRLNVEQLYAAAMLLYPTWYDPHRDALGSLETAILALGADARAWREDRQGSVATGIRLWKRGHLRRFFEVGRVGFKDDPGKAVRLAAGRQAALLCWSKPKPELAKSAASQGQPLHRVEDGFLRSRGLGAELVPPMSLVRDGAGIYFDPTDPSDLESLIRRSVELPEAALTRALRLRQSLIDLHLTKYNVGTRDLPQIPENRKIVLVVGQVEDDASVQWGAARRLNTNSALLAAAREARPDAFLIYKPHPDVEAGLRKGSIAVGTADAVAEDTDADTLLGVVDEVWTITSLLGFEALIRGVDVICAGRPFYAGWGLTTDLPCALDAALGERRAGVRPTVEGVIHAALIDYPRYRDPVTGRPCPVEVVVERLAEKNPQKSGPGLRILSKLQGLLASHAPFWR